MPIGKGAIGQGMDYNVDIVMCIDATGSMASIIDDVKRNALSFYQKFVDEMEAKAKSVQQLRIKVIAFFMGSFLSDAYKSAGTQTRTLSSLREQTSTSTP